MNGWLVPALFSVQLLAMALSFYRIWKGPSRADRVLIFDLLSSIGICLLLVAGVHFSSELFLDIAILLGLLSFAGTIGFTYFLEKEGCQ